MLAWLYRVSDALRDGARRRRWNATRAAGRRGEDLAHRYLQRLGLTVVARNWQREEGGGEIDVIAWDGDTLVFVEVKSRQTDEFGAPDRAIGGEKESLLIRAARTYARRAKVSWERVRFDVVNIVVEPQLKIDHVPDAFSTRAERSFVPQGDHRVHSGGAARGNVAGQNGHAG